jgi:hypothetical protein
MAKVRILLEAGQENASAVGDIQGWEALYDFYALRNPSTTGGPTFAQGSYKDTFQLTGTFPGGWTADALGAEEIGEFQTANCAGAALQMVKQAVFYNPTPSYLTYDKSTSDYPGRFRLSGSSQLPHRVTTDMMGQAGGIVKTLTGLSSGTFTTSGAHGLAVDDYVTFGISAAGGVSGLIFGDRAYKVKTTPLTTTFTVEEWPTGDAVTGTGTVTNIKVAQVFPMTITRHRTNTTHTAVPGGVIDRTDGDPFVLNVEPPLDPAPAENEVFDHELVLMANAASATGSLVLNRQLGGYRDGGSSLESDPNKDAKNIRIGYEMQASNVPQKFRLTMPGMQVRPGMPIALTESITSYANAGVQAVDFNVGSDTFTGATSSPNFNTGHGLVNNQRIKFDTVLFPAGLSSGQDAFVRDATATTFKVSDAVGGIAKNITDVVAAGGGTQAIIYLRAHGDLNAARLYVTRVAEAGEQQSLTWADTITRVTGNKLQRSASAAHMLTEGEEIVFSGGTPATGITNGTSYFVKQVAGQPSQFQLMDARPVKLIVSTSAATLTVFEGAHTFYVGQTVKFTSDDDTPGGFSSGTTYYVKATTSTTITLAAGSATGDAITPSGIPTNKFAQLGGIVVALSGTGSGVCTITRPESHCSFYVSDEVGGEDLAYSSDEAIVDNVHASNRLSQFSGYLNGLQLRCSSAATASSANVGKSVMLKHVQLDETGSATVSKLHHNGTWSATPQEGDKFVIEPPPVSGSAVPFDEFCKILPWSPFEGRSAGQGTPYAVTLASTNTVSGDAAIAEFYTNAAVQFFTTGQLPNGLTPGKTYYITGFTRSTGAFTYSETYGGTAVSHESSSTESGTHYMVCVDALGKDNPFPPGFNYPGQYSVPEVYQPDRGPRRRPGIEISSGVTLALRMATHYGEPILHINCAFPGSTIQHREIGTETGVGFGHYDPARQVSWSKGEPDGCFARLEAVLAGVKRALDEQGDTGEVELVTWMQGEEEAKSTTLSENYKASLRQLKKDLRAAVVSAGLSTKAAERIPFVQALVREKHTTPTALDGTAVLRTSAEAVNTAIKAVADEDPHSRYVDLTSVSTNYEADLGGTEYIRYSGVGMDYLGKSLFTAWESLQVEPAYTDVQICNLALANLGDKATITAFRPSDGSRQADLCAQFYDLALNGVLQRHPWDFSIRRTSPTKATTDRTEWLYSFYLPDDFVGVLAVLPKEPKDDVCYMGRHTPLEYAIELDANYTRRIYCNQDDVVLRYHAKVTDPHHYSEMFVQALSWKLATLLAGPLIKGEAGVKAAQSSQQMFEFMMQQATAFDATKTRERKLETYHLAEFDRDRGETGELSDWDRNR